MDQLEAERQADARFAEHAEDLRRALAETFREVLPGNHSPAQALLLAHLMTATDGYNEVIFTPEWALRPTIGAATSLAFLPEIFRNVVVDFAFEARYFGHVAQMVVLIDDYRPGERIAAKLQRENVLVSAGIRVVVFSENEVLGDASACRRRVEQVLLNIVEGLLTDAGVIPEADLDGGDFA